MRSHIKMIGVAIALAAAISTAGITGVGRARGPISAFGSIFVNGVEYTLTSAQISANGSPATEQDLRVGQIVTVDGFVNPDLVTGTAAVVSYDGDVRGAVAGVDAATSSLTVLGQVVRVNGGTSFDPSFEPANLAGIAQGVVVEVSGYRDSADNLLATRVARSAAADDRIVGMVSALDTAVFSFHINALTVDYSAAGQLEGTLADGEIVEVKGTRTTSLVLRATAVEVVSAELGGAPGTGGSVEGLVTSALSNGQFIVAGQTVIVAASTEFVNGSAADLLPDAKVQAEGLMDAGGAIVAEKVTFKFDNDAGVHGVIAELDSAKQTVTVAGITLSIDTDTRIEDKSDLRLRPFRFTDLRPGEMIDADGYELHAPRNVKATRLERVQDDSRTWLRGDITSLRTGEFDLLDTVVQTTRATEYHTATGKKLTAKQFFAQAANREVKARGQFNGAALLADEVSFRP